MAEEYATLILINIIVTLIHVYIFNSWEFDGLIFWTMCLFIIYHGVTNDGFWIWCVWVFQTLAL